MPSPQWRHRPVPNPGARHFGPQTPGSRGEHAPPVRFPGYDVLAQTGTWDVTTIGSVLARTTPQPDLRFFTPDEEAVAHVLLDHLLAQWDEPRVPVLQMIDARLTEAQTDGWHYADMPEDGEAWRRSLAALDADARAAHGRGFAAISREDQAARIQAVQDLGDDPWHDMPAGHVWSLWTRYACTAFYSHPWAWNEIGFGGPAYPRGYSRLGVGLREPWEVADHDPRDPATTARDEGRAVPTGYGDVRAGEDASDGGDTDGAPGPATRRGPAHPGGPDTGGRGRAGRRSGPGGSGGPGNPGSPGSPGKEGG